MVAQSFQRKGAEATRLATSRTMGAKGLLKRVEVELFRLKKKNPTSFVLCSYEKQKVLGREDGSFAMPPPADSTAGRAVFAP